MKPANRIGIQYLPEVWQHYHNLRASQPIENPLDWSIMLAFFGTLGLGLEPTVAYLLGQGPSLEEFEAYIEKYGVVSPSRIAAFNEAVSCERKPYAPGEAVLSQDDLDHWESQGFVVVKGALSPDECADTLAWTYKQLGINPNDPGTWYDKHPLKQEVGTLVQLFGGRYLERNRGQDRIRLAFEQLWQRNDLLASVEGLSLNPPTAHGHKFRGPHLHWDISLKQPIPFATRGLVYLTDTNAQQGGLSLVPGFHRGIADWLEDFAPGIDPRHNSVMRTLEQTPIVAEAGDLILWNHTIPHGSSPNLGQQLSVAQYINYQPLQIEYQTEWV